MNPEHQLEDPIKVIERMQRENRAKMVAGGQAHSQSRQGNTGANHIATALEEIEERTDKIFHPKDH